MGVLPPRVSGPLLRPVSLDEPQFCSRFRRELPLERIQSGMGDIAQEAFQHQLVELHEEFPVVRSYAVSWSADEASEAAILVIEDSGLAQGKHKTVAEDQGKSGRVAGDRINAGDNGGSGEQPRLYAAGAEQPSQHGPEGLEYAPKVHWL